MSKFKFDTKEFLVTCKITNKLTAVIKSNISIEQDELENLVNEIERVVYKILIDSYHVN